eukprot:6936805-Prymnesium_polylepis.1
MECRLMQRTALEHRFERVLEADIKASYFTTVHERGGTGKIWGGNNRNWNSYQIQEAPTVVTYVSCWQSDLQPPCRLHAGGRRNRYGPEQTARNAGGTRRTKRSHNFNTVGSEDIWLQDLDRKAPLDLQEGRIKRWLKEDTCLQLGESVGDAMLFALIEWPGDRFQWSVRVPAGLLAGRCAQRCSWPNRGSGSPTRWRGRSRQRHGSRRGELGKTSHC